MSNVRALSRGEIDLALSIVDLSDPARGAHAVQRIVDAVAARLCRAWDHDVMVHRAHPVTNIDDNYDNLGYAPDAPSREARYTRYVSETQLLRSHTSAAIPPLLRRLRRDGWSRSRLLVCPGIVYRRDVIDRLHTGEPHQLDLWRLVPAAEGTVGPTDLEAMIGHVVDAALPGARWRTSPAVHPYTTAGRQIDIWEAEAGEWIEIGECGLAHPAVLVAAGLEPSGWTGLAMGLGLDRMVMLRKGIDDIRLLRSAEDRVARQMLDLTRYRPVSRQPAVRRDMSIAVDAEDDAELLGDRVRSVLGRDAGLVEAIELRSETPYAGLPEPAVARLGMHPSQKNALVRVVLRDLHRSLTHDEANQLRDRIYAALHRGARHEWAVGPPRPARRASE